MSLTVQGSGSSATTTVTIPAHAVGDMIVIMARGTAAPTIPGAGGTVPSWVEIGTGGVNNSVGLRVARTIATATNHTSGTWTGATQMHVLVIRKSGSGSFALGNAPAQAGANNTQTIVYPALTFTAGRADNLAVRFGARITADTEVRTSGGFTTGGTFRTEQPATTPTSAVFTKPITANEGAFTATTAGTNAAYRALSFEITETIPRPAVPTGAYGSVVHATSGLLHYWRLDEPSNVVALDYKSTLDGAYVGSPTLGAAGLIASEAGSKSVQLDGTNDSVDIPDAASLDLTSAISVEFWVDATSAFPADDTVVQKGGAWSFWSAGGALRFEVDGANSAERPGGATPSGKYHVVGTYDRTTVRLYLNGVEVATGAATTAIIATATLMAVGRDTGGAPLYFAGKVSDVAVYNVALAPATVLAHYNAAQAAGPGIYSKTGGATTALSSGGSDKGVFSRQGGGAVGPESAGGAKKVVKVETGGAISVRSSGGPKAVSQAFTKTGGGVGVRSSGGPKVVAYADTGGATSALTTGGAKLAASIETGGATSALSTGGGKKPIYADTGGATSALFAGGAKAVSQSVPKTGGGATPLSTGGPKLVQQAYPKTGGASTPLTTGGPKNPAYADTGGATSALSTGGPKKTVYADTGGATTAFSVGGAKKLVSIETGGAVTGLLAGAGKQLTKLITGGGATALSTGGAKKVVYTATGGAVVPFSAGGPSSVSAGGVFDKTGGGVTTLVGGATKLLTKLATGGGISARLAGAAKLLAKVATGGGVTACTTGGAKKVQYQDTGGASSTLTTGGAKKLVSIETGGATVVLVAGGPKSLALSFSKTGGGIGARLAGAAKVAASVKAGGGASSLTGGTSKNVVVVRGGPGGAGYVEEVLTDSPRYYWRMGDLPPPLAPSAGTPELELGASSAPDAVAGAIVADDGAAQFDGTFDGVRAPDIDFTDTGILTVELWLWWDSYANNDDLAMEFGTGSGQEGFFLNPNSSIGAGGTPIAGAVFGVAMHPGAVGSFFEVGFARPSAGAWHHIVAVMDKSLTPAADTDDSDAIKLYVDGERQQGWVLTNSNKNGEEWGGFSPRTLYVMSRSGSSLIAAGRVDELALYPGVLSEARIEAHYAAGSTVAGPGGVGATSSMGGGGSSVLDFGNLVTKTGGAASGLLAGGTKVIAAVLPKTGGGASALLAGATKLLTKVVTGGGRLTATTGGSKKVQYADTGGATSLLRTGGTKQLSSTKTGGANVVFSAGGPKVADFGLFFNKTGGAVVPLSVGATKVVASTRTGGGLMVLTTGGARKTVYSDTGGATLIMRSGGGYQVAAVKTGGGVLALRAGGPSSLDFGQFISKTGGAVAGLLSGGAKKLVRLVTGGGLVPLLSGATKRAEARDSGGATLGLTAGGVKAPVRSYTGGAVLSVLAGGGTETDRTQTKTGGGRAALSSGSPKLVLSDHSGGATVPWRTGGGVARSITLEGGAVLELSSAASMRVTSVRTGGGRLGYTAGSGTAFRGGAFVNFTAGASTTLTIVRSGGATLGLLAAGSRLLVPTGESGGRLLSGGARHAVLSSSGRRGADVLNANERGLVASSSRRGGEVEGSRHHADLT